MAQNIQRSPRRLLAALADDGCVIGVRALIRVVKHLAGEGHQHLGFDPVCVAEVFGREEVVGRRSPLIVLLPPRGPTFSRHGSSLTVDCRQVSPSGDICCW
jgi:hypothetical protein